MNVLILQIVVAVATTIMLFLHWQLWCRHRCGRERRVVPVRREQRPPAPYVSRVGTRVHHRRQVLVTRTVALSTLPMPIRGTVEPAEPVQLVRADVAPTPVRPGDLRFAPPDVALMRRVIEGLRALPERPRDTPPV